MHAFGSSQMRPLFVAFMLAVSLVSGLGAVPGSQEVQDTADPRAGAQSRERTDQGALADMRVGQMRKRMNHRL